MSSGNIIERIINKLKTDFYANIEYIDEQEMEVLQASFKQMRLFRLSPQPGKKLTFTDVLIFCLILFPFIWIDSSVNIIKQYMNREKLIAYDILENIVISTSGGSMYILMGIVIYKNEDIVNLAKKLGDFRQFRKPRYIDRANYIANTFASFFFIYTVIGTLFTIFLHFLNRGSCLEENVELNVERVCGLLIPTIWPYFFNDYPYFFIPLVPITYSATAICAVLGIMYGFFFGATRVTTARVRHLSEEIQSAFNASSEKLRKERLKNCVRYHVFLIDLVAHLNRCVSSMCMLQTIFTIISMAVIGAQFFLKPQLGPVIHASGWIVVLLVTCYGGQILINETDLIPMYIYNTDWFEYDVETQKMVLMIIQHGNEGLHVDTIMFGAMGFTTFSMVMQNAYGILCLIYDQIK